jgi:hypothetical protein
VFESTHHTESANELLGRLDTGCADHLDEVGADADDEDHAEGLKNPDAEEHLAQRHGVVGWNRHVGGLSRRSWMWKVD